MNQPVILFDGVCNLCNGFVQFIIQQDPSGKFKFASLQSAYAREKLAGAAINQSNLDTVVFLHDGKLYTKSTAALKIARHLGNGWSLLYPLVYLPKFFRDGIYNLIAKNRYKWFGRQESCMLPSPDLSSRFLD